MDRNRKLPKTTQVLRKKFVCDKILNKEIMHIGCTGGLLDEVSIKEYPKSFIKEEDTHFIFSKFANEISGLDISEDKILFYKQSNMPGKYYVSDITSNNFNHDKKYQSVVFGEVIEHLDNVGQSLKNIEKILSKDGELIITTVNAFDIKIILKMFFNYESVHNEHTAYYSYSTLKRVLEMNNYYIAEFYFAENERKKTNDIMLLLSNMFGRIFSTLFKQFSQGIVVVAKLKSS